MLARGLSLPPASYYVPSEVYDGLIDAKLAFEKMDQSPIRMKIIKLSPGETVHVNKFTKVVAISTVHRVKSQGYALYSIRKGALREEFRNLSQSEVRNCKLTGTNILEDDEEKLEIVYTGDTSMDVFDLPGNSFITSSPILILELTYIDGDRSKARQYGHIHIDDIVENASLFDSVKELIFVHFSQKYSMSRIIQVLKEKLPVALQRKVKCSLHSFGAGEVLTSLDDSRFVAEATSTIAGWGWGLQGSGSATKVKKDDIFADNDRVARATFERKDNSSICVEEESLHKNVSFDVHKVDTNHGNNSTWNHGGNNETSNASFRKRARKRKGRSLLKLSRVVAFKQRSKAM